jgi:hypothetical protein
LHELARTHKVGIEVALIPPAADPKDLFGELALAAIERARADHVLASV